MFICSFFVVQSSGRQCVVSSGAAIVRMTKLHLNVGQPSSKRRIKFQVKQNIFKFVALLFSGMYGVKLMETLLAYCGLRCDTCPIHLATLEQDVFQQQAMRRSIAEQCSALYGRNLQPEDITDCDGCRATTERIFSACFICEIRKCARGKKMDSCAFCSNYACEPLVKLFSLDPGAKIRLEEIRQKLL